MKDITLSHYTVKDINPAPWRETWDNLSAFAERMAAKMAPMGIRIKLRKAVIGEITQDTLMMGNMVTAEAPELGTAEMPIEDLLTLELDYSACGDCLTPDGAGFPCRTLEDFDGVPRQALQEEFFMEAALRVAFKAGGHGCSCSDCGGDCCGH